MCLEADFSHSADTRSPAPHTHIRNLKLRIHSPSCQISALRES